MTHQALITPRSRTSDTLCALIEALKALGYTFTSVTPATHKRVIDRPDMRQARDLRGVFGWNLPFERDLLPDDLLALLEAADAVERFSDGRFRSHVRVSSFARDLLVHSSYPTDATDAVFFGPDSYRYAAFIQASIARDPRPVASVLDYGTGTGIGGIAAARASQAPQVTLADINPKALAFAAANALAAGVDARLLEVGALGDAPDAYDLIVAHPPFMIDTARRTYRDGGDLWGGRVSVDWALAACDKLAPGGRVVMHTGASIVDGRDPLRAALEEALTVRNTTLDYVELEVDYYGEELETAAYADVERLAMVGIVLTKTGA